MLFPFQAVEDDLLIPWEWHVRAGADASQRPRVQTLETWVAYAGSGGRPMRRHP